MTNIDKVIKIMNAVSGYERFKHSKGDKFIQDTKMDVGYFPWWIYQRNDNKALHLCRLS